MGGGFCVREQFDAALVDAQILGHEQRELDDLLEGSFAVGVADYGVERDACAVDEGAIDGDDLLLLGAEPHGDSGHDGELLVGGLKGNR